MINQQLNCNYTKQEDDEKLILESNGTILQRLSTLIKRVVYSKHIRKVRSYLGIHPLRSNTKCIVGLIKIKNQYWISVQSIFSYHGANNFTLLNINLIRRRYSSCLRISIMSFWRTTGEGYYNKYLLKIGSNRKQEYIIKEVIIGPGKMQFVKLMLNLNLKGFSGNIWIIANRITAIFGL